MTEPTMILPLIRDGGLACVILLTLVVCLVVVWRGVLQPCLVMLQNIFSTLERTSQDLRVSTDNLRAAAADFGIKAEKKPES
jgi:hypothetical protein